MHQARRVGRGQDLGACRADRGDLVVTHGQRGVDVLDREGATEPAAFVCAGNVDQGHAIDRGQEPLRPVTDAQEPDRMAGRVERHGMAKVGPDVGHAEDVHQQLGQVVALAATSPTSETRRALPSSSAISGWWRRTITAHDGDEVTIASKPANARANRRTSGTQSSRYPVLNWIRPQQVLRVREVDLVAQAPEQPHESLADLREEEIVEAGDEQRDSHGQATGRPVAGVGS